ncbi:MAG: hypothetical protein ABSF77_12975 [Spirochaetia bacterium]|jgi:hypothetical protein
MPCEARKGVEYTATKAKVFEPREGVAACGVCDLDAALKVRAAGAARVGAKPTEAIMEECYWRKRR